MKKILLLALTSFFLTAPLYAAETAEKTEKKAEKKSVITLSMGRADAPVVIDEYASLGCPHCQDFHKNTLPQLKATFIDSGRVRIIFHHFPLDKASVDAALFVHCVPADQAWDVVKLLYDDQENWARDPKYQTKFLGYAAMLGLPEKTLKACLADTAKRDEILKARVHADKKLKVESTPTFIFNKGTAKLSGTQSFEQMSNIINKM
ncbi:MAG TPA: thioredoxin domain-containing protein [Alphaproteobacteria bacterium]|nr:hypothetical protein [Rhodospirillaceae bacterium]HRJ13272.1 thioredoxin domain-containing protein [Alphaproteobacteria bacterium]